MSPRPNRKIAGHRPIGAKVGWRAPTAPTDAQRTKGSRNGGAVAHARAKAEQTPAEKWEQARDGVLERFLADMKTRYADEENDQ